MFGVFVVVGCSCLLLTIVDVVRCSLFVVSCLLLFAVCCLLFVICCWLLLFVVG